MQITDEMVDWVWNRTNDVSRKKVEAVLERAAQYDALSASPVGVGNPWRLDKALTGYETVMNGSREAILRFTSEDEFLFFIEAMAKGSIMSAIEPAGVKPWGEMQAEDCVLSIGSKRTCGHGTLGCVNHHAPPPPIEPAGVGVETEVLARRIYEDAHKGMSNIWAWDDQGLDDEHPGTRERYLGYARSARASLKGDEQ